MTKPTGKPRGRPRMKRLPLCPEILRRAMVNSGNSYTSLAARVGVSELTIRLWIKNGWPEKREDDLERIMGYNLPDKEGV